MGQKHACLNISELSREHIGPLSSFWKPNQKAPPWPLTSNSCIRVFAAKVDRSHQVPERHTRHRDDCNFCVTHWEMTVTNKAPLHPQLILSCMAIMIFLWHDGINAAANLSAAWWVGLGWCMCVCACGARTTCVFAICLHRLEGRRLNGFICSASSRP